MYLFTKENLTIRVLVPPIPHAYIHTTFGISCNRNILDSRSTAFLNFADAHLPLSPESIFPPVMTRRLLPQSIYTGDRLVMEVEIAGTPTPAIQWFKDNIPIAPHSPEYRLRQQGNSYAVIVEKGIVHTVSVRAHTFFLCLYAELKYYAIHKQDSEVQRPYQVCLCCLS